MIGEISPSNRSDPVQRKLIKMVKTGMRVLTFDVQYWRQMADLGGIGGCEGGMIER